MNNAIKECVRMYSHIKFRLRFPPADKRQHSNVNSCSVILSFSKIKLHRQRHECNQIEFLKIPSQPVIKIVTYQSNSVNFSQCVMCILCHLKFSNWIGCIASSFSVSLFLRQTMNIGYIAPLNGLKCQAKKKNGEKALECQIVEQFLFQTMLTRLNCGLSTVSMMTMTEMRRWQFHTRLPSVENKKQRRKKKCYSERNYHQFHSVRKKIVGRFARVIKLLHCFASRNAKECRFYKPLPDLIDGTEAKTVLKIVKINVDVAWNVDLPFSKCAQNSYVDRVAKSPIDTWHFCSMFNFVFIILFIFSITSNSKWQFQFVSFTLTSDRSSNHKKNRQKRQMELDFFCPFSQNIFDIFDGCDDAKNTKLNNNFLVHNNL